MNLLRSLPRERWMLVLLCVFSLMLGEHQSTASGQQSSQQSKTNHAAIYTDQDSYQIYTTLLEGEKKHLYVIQAEIDGHPDLTSKNLGIEGDKEFMREWEPVMDDYAERHHTAKLPQRTFSLRTSYELVPASSILNGQKDWNDYYRRYPAPGGFYWFSAVGFNPARTRAIADMGHACGELCLKEGPRFFEKKDGKWREVFVTATVIAWFS